MLTDIESGSICTICFNQVDEETKWKEAHLLNCDCPKEYHSECINHWFSVNPVCPICKTVKQLTEKEKKQLRIKKCCRITRFICQAMILGSLISSCFCFTTMIVIYFIFLIM